MAGIKKILVPTDFSEASKESLRYACTLAGALHASLHIIHVNHNPYVSGDSSSSTACRRTSFTRWNARRPGISRHC